MNNFFLALSFAFLCIISHQTGQWTPADLDSSIVSTSLAEIQQYSITQLSYFGIIPSDHQYISTSHIYTQVVAGINWKFDLVFSNGIEEKTINVVVWQKLPYEEERFKLTHLSVETSLVDDSVHLLGGWTENLNENLEDLKNILNFGLKNLAEKAEETKDLKFIRINKVQTQIINGKNYKFVLQFTNKDGGNVNYQIIIWVNREQMNLISHFKEAEREVNVSKNILLGGWAEIDHENLDLGAEKARKFADSRMMANNKFSGFYYLKMERAFKQVVAGIKYKYVLIYRNDSLNQEMRFEVIILRKLDGFNTENEIFELLDINELD